MVKSKNNLRVLLFLLPIALIVFVSGCTNNNGIAVGNGVTINAFQPDFPQIYSGDDLRLQIEVENKGERDATNVRAELSGISSEEWGSYLETYEFGKLLAITTTSDGTMVKGETKTGYWDLTAPYLAKGLEHTFTPNVRVSYDYTGSAQKMIKIIDKNELRNMIAAGQGNLQGGETSQTAGPVTINIETAPYVQSTQIGTGIQYDIFPVNIHIENTQFSSGATVVKPLAGIGPETYPVIVEIYPPQGTNFVYSGYGDDCSQFVVVDLFRGRDADITCELQINDPPSIAEDRAMEVSIAYRYSIDASSSIKVVGV